MQRPRNMRQHPKTTRGFEHLKFADVPEEFMDATGYSLADYSVAIGHVTHENPLRFEIFGSGVLVQKGKRCGLLTAHHCVHGPDAPEFRFGSFDGDKLVLVLKRSHLVVLPPEILVKHDLGIPTADGEPDLAFVEFLASPQLGAVRAVSSFWSLDRDFGKIATEFGQFGMPFTVIGFPGTYHQTKREGNIVRKIIKHMAFFYAIRPKGIFSARGWDYVEATNRYDQGNELPPTFHGVSGGPVWGLKIKREKQSGRLILNDFALLGIAISQIRASKKALRVRAHFIRSIYELAWLNLNGLSCKPAGKICERVSFSRPSK